MAIDVYLQLDGIKGESVDNDHPGWIECTSAQWGVSQPKSATSSTAGGHTAERCEIRSISLKLESRPIPDEARATIREVRTAAKAKDFSSLRRLMVPEFTWSFGGDGDADQAIDAWRRDPAAMRELYRVTGRRCVFQTDEMNIQCPPNAGYNYRAGFVKTGQGWRMSYFVAGD